LSPATTVDHPSAKDPHRRPPLTRCMRKVAIVLVGAVTLSMPADGSAQTVGVEAGLALGSLSSYRTANVDEAFDASARRGATVGVFVDVPVARHLAVEAGASFVEKGARLTPVGTRDEAITIAKLSYLEFPVLLRIDTARAGVRPFAVVGPSFGVNVGAHVDASASGGPSNLDVGSQLRTADVRLAFGGGVSSGAWFVEGRFTQGLIDVGETRRGDEVVPTSTISLLPGLRF